MILDARLHPIAPQPQCRAPRAIVPPRPQATAPAAGPSQEELLAEIAKLKQENERIQTTKAKKVVVPPPIPGTGSKPIVPPSTKPIVPPPPVPARGGIVPPPIPKPGVVTPPAVPKPGAIVPPPVPRPVVVPTAPPVPPAPPAPPTRPVAPRVAPSQPPAPVAPLPVPPRAAMDEADDVKKGSARQWTEEKLAQAKRAALAAAQHSDDDSESGGDDDEDYEKAHDLLISRLRGNLERQARIRWLDEDPMVGRRACLHVW